MFSINVKFFIPDILVFTRKQASSVLKIEY